MRDDASRLTASPTIGAASRSTAGQFRAAGLDSPDRDARLLVAAAAGIGVDRLLLEPETVLRPAAADRLAGFVARRLGREPVARILGERGFYGRDFAVTPATLDPRPDSETLIDVALNVAADEGWHQRPIRILDVGTGSGILLVTLLAELPRALGVGTDISRDALVTAQSNAARHLVADRARFEQIPSLDGIVGPFDLLISNPPYIATADIPSLDPEVARYDPLVALDGGPDGLEVYRQILSEAARVVPSGWLLFEVGLEQADPVIELARREIVIEGGLTVRIASDLSGVPRCVALRTHQRSG